MDVVEDEEVGRNLRVSTVARGGGDEAGNGSNDGNGGTHFD